MPASGAPCTRTSPDDGASRPAATLSSVDLPQPVGPTTETNSPSATRRVAFATAVYGGPPSRPANRQVMSSSASAGTPLIVVTASPGPSSGLRVLLGALGELVGPSLAELDLV